MLPEAQGIGGGGGEVIGKIQRHRQARIGQIQRHMQVGIGQQQRHR